jgi:hypothetical protein
MKMRQNIARFLTIGLILGAILSSAIPSLAYPETNKINTMEITTQSISGYNPTKEQNRQ